MKRRDKLAVPLSGYNCGFVDEKLTLVANAVPFSGTVCRLETIVTSFFLE